MIASVGSIHIQSVPLFNNKDPLAVFMARGQDEQAPSPSNIPLSEAERLLDVEGLLEIAKLISRIRDEGRLGAADGDRLDHLDEQT
jgi:hypothetical protein